MPYRTEQIDAATGREALLRLWTENLPVQGDAEAKLRWSYLEGGSQAFLLRAPDDMPVGCASVQLREFVYRDQVARAGLLGDFAVDRKHRTGFPALTLQRGVKRFTDVHYDLSYGFPNDNAVAVHRRTGYHELGRMDRYVRVLRSGGYLERRFGGRRLARLAGEILDRAMLAMTVADGYRLGSRVELRWLDDVDARFDQLWDEAQRSYPIACRRNVAFLRWRFMRKPDEAYSIAALIDPRTDAVRAYAMVHDGPDGGAVLADLFGVDLDSIETLLGRVIRTLYHRGYVTVGFRYLGDPRLRPILARHRFSLRDSRRAVIISTSPSWPLDRDAHDPNAWYLTDLDEDI